MNAIYVRTSKDDNDGSAQLHELKAWAEAQGWKGWREYVDQGETGKKDSRPQWDKLRDDVRKGKVKQLVATEISRVGRSVVNVILALDDCYRAGGRVVLLRQGLDYATPIGRAVAAILAAVAQLEHDQITERIRSGVRRAQKEGTRSGKPVGRPTRVVTEEQIYMARGHAAVGIGWKKIAKLVGVPATTIRRAVEARQNPRQKQGEK